MLRFLFSFCGAEADATNVKPKDRDILVAFQAVQDLANEQTKLPRSHLSSA